jgi:hypothetical protein
MHLLVSHERTTKVHGIRTKKDPMDVHCEKQTEHVISVGTAQNLNVNYGGTCLLFGFKRLVVNVIALLVNLF